MGKVNIDLDQAMERALALLNSRTGDSREQAAVNVLRQGLLGGNQGNAVFLSAPVNALVQGLFEQDTPMSEIKARGDFGLGTFNDLDGEMMMLDGDIFQMRADGKVYPVDNSARTPFACVTFFTPDTRERIDENLDNVGFSDLLTRMIPSQNMLYAIRVEGTFPYVRTRSVPRQENYRPLVEVARDQPEFEYRDVTGTMAGFFTPAYMQSLNVPGVHLHFLSSDRTFGGHLLECSMTEADISIQHVPRLVLGLPVTLDFLTADFSGQDIAGDLEKAER